MPDPLRVRAVVVTWQGAHLLPACLDSLLRQRLTDAELEVVVVDNASTDATLDVVAAEAPEATVVRLDRTAGHAASVNAAVAAGHPSTRTVLVLHADVRLTSGSVPVLLDALNAFRVGIVVPRLVGPDGTLEHSLRREPTLCRALGHAVLGGRLAGMLPPLGEVVRRRSAYERDGTADAAIGAVMLVSRRCLAAVGGWDESFSTSSEEIDFALRARDAGLALRYVPAATAVHLGDGTSASTDPRLATIQTLDRIRLHRRRHGRSASAAFAGALALDAMLRAPTSRAHRASLTALVRPGRRPAEIGDRPLLAPPPAPPTPRRATASPGTAAP